MTSLFNITNNGLTSIKRSTLAREDILEGWIAADPSIVGLDILVIGQQIVTDFGGVIDILALERNGDVVILELKRDKTPRNTIAQILDYASWVQTLTTRQIHEITATKLGTSLELAFSQKFDMPVPESLNNNHSMIIVASQFDAPSKRIVEYLSETHDLSINTAFFNVFETQDGNQILATDWLMDQEQVVERSEAKKKAPWSGFYYANIGHDDTRSWEDMRKYGFLAAGGGRWYSRRLEKLAVGDKVFGYQPKSGYVGFGYVTQPSVIAKDFMVEDSHLLELPLDNENIGHHRDDPEMADYIVGMDWKKTVPLTEAITFTGMFANQNIIAKLRSQETLERLFQEFGLNQNEL